MSKKLVQTQSNEILRQSTLRILNQDLMTPRSQNSDPIAKTKARLAQKHKANAGDFNNNTFEVQSSSSQSSSSSSTATQKASQKKRQIKAMSQDLEEHAGGKLNKTHNNGVVNKQQYEVSDIDNIKFGFFQQTRHETYQQQSPRDFSDQTEEKKRPKGYKFKSSSSNLPSRKFTVTLSINSSMVLKLFQQICKRKSFQIIEIEENLATAVYREPFSFKKLFSYCIPSKNRNSANSMVSAIKLQIYVKESTMKRKILIRGFYGVGAVLKSFILEFQKKFKSLIDSQSKYQRSFQFQ